jgi:hypothetical protein
MDVKELNTQVGLFELLLNFRSVALMSIKLGLFMWVGRKYCS